jgi:hypothetical protein
LHDVFLAIVIGFQACPMVLSSKTIIALISSGDTLLRASVCGLRLLLGLAHDGFDID